MNAKTPKGNGSHAASSQAANLHRARASSKATPIRRTLFGAAIGALFAWFFFVPVVEYGPYLESLHARQIRYSGTFSLLNLIGPSYNEIKINAPLLAVNVAFFTLLGAVAFWAVGSVALKVRGRKLPRWAWQGIAGIVAIALITIGAVAWRNFTEAAAIRARSATSPYATAPDFAKYAMKRREQALLKVEPQILPSAIPETKHFPWKMDIVTTAFWIGGPTETNKSLRTASAWDPTWDQNYGGLDNPDPSARRNYIPVAFIPRQNPFYCALPYNDVVNGQFKPEAPSVIPWFKQTYVGPGQSVCKDRWVAIRKGDRTCYAQWEDCGPFLTDHFKYVFQNYRPKPNANHGAGLNVSPAVRDYLGLAPTDVTDWQFVEVRDVPAGPWRNYGENNHFVIARRQTEKRLKEQQGKQENSTEPKN